MIEVFAAQKKRHKLEKRTKMVAELKDFLKADQTYRELCEEYDHDESIIDGIPVVFTSEIDVTAKTVNAKVFINTSIIDDKFNV